MNPLARMSREALVERQRAAISAAEVQARARRDPMQDVLDGWKRQAEADRAGGLAHQVTSWH